ncbi:PIPK domain-containing protein [Aphelenchoides fujianensis]|nr:PIPK domain-containing protein [Aphelenchoides fujianensis]
MDVTVRQAIGVLIFAKTFEMRRRFTQDGFRTSLDVRGMPSRGFSTSATSPNGPTAAASPSTSRAAYGNHQPAAVAPSSHTARVDGVVPPLYVSKPDDVLQEVRFEDDGPPTGGGPTKEGSTKHKEKIGHRRIDRQGEVSYKRVPTNALMGAIQLGISNSIGSLASRPLRDLLVQDFDVIETVAFPTDGSTMTPSHAYGDFRFKTYAPLAFRYFREIFHIQAADFLQSLCTQPLRELSNPGASGSIFYVSADDKFIIKTVQHKEADFLCKLLPGYYMNLQQNPRTVLPKFFGLFCYQSLGKNIRLIVMNNLLPQSVRMHQKFDLKGSTYKRFASRQERQKPSPTLKDLDFNEEFPNGITLDPKTYDILMNIIERDCLVLESFKIMDYSFLIGIHNIDLEAQASGVEEDEEAAPPEPLDPEEEQRQLTERTEAWRALQLDFNAKQRHYAEGGVPARNQKGERLLLFLGIIDILQNYRLFKKLEHTWKSILHDGDSISVHNPSFYAERFQTYIGKHVFIRAELTGAAGRHPNKFRSIVHSFMAIKQHPSKHNRTKSVADQTDDSVLEPMISGRGGIDRRSHFKTDSDKRRKERLFASTNAEARPLMPDSSSTPLRPLVSPTVVMVGDEPTPVLPRPSTSRTRPLETSDIHVEFTEAL